MNETSSFPGDVPPIATAIPAFVGYTEKAMKDDQNVLHIPVRIASMDDYQAIFGGAPAVGSRFFLFYSLQLYFANGGAGCYIVSIGNYSDTPEVSDFFSKADARATRSDKPRGIDTLVNEAEPTLLVSPDTVLLAAPTCFQVQRYMLAHCAQVQNRFAILDIPNGFQSRTGGNDDVIQVFRQQMKDAENLSWGAVYYPWLKTGQTDDPMPPSGAIAGVYCATDAQTGVFKAPANVALAGVAGLTVSIPNNDQEDLNSPIDGKAVNAIRAFPGRGNLVWGARTLAGNDNEWRYVSVRRTMIYIEQSLKALLEPYGLSQNTPATWTAVRAMIENFLTGFWRDGGLQGPVSKDAFVVQVGLGTTMTQQDIAEGNMIIQVGMALLRPTEFIWLTLKQRMLPV